MIHSNKHIKKEQFNSLSGGAIILTEPADLFSLVLPYPSSLLLFYLFIFNFNPSPSLPHLAYSILGFFHSTKFVLLIMSDSESSGDDSYTVTNVLLGYTAKEPKDDEISHLGGRPVC